MVRQKQKSKVGDAEVEITYVGPCARFVDVPTGNVFVNGESTSIDVDIVKRLLTDHPTKFVSDQAHVEVVIDVPKPEEETPSVSSFSAEDSVPSEE